MADDQRVQFVKSVRDRLNAVSPSFCTQKWLHQTLYLHTGDNHSCYHPRPHHIGLDEIAKDPSQSPNLLALGDGSVEGLKGAHITQAAKDGNTVALAALATTGRYIGEAISSLSVLFDPKIVVIGGGVVDAGDLLLDPARKAMLATMPFNGKHPLPQIVAAQMGNEAGLVGAADLARR